MDTLTLFDAARDRRIPVALYHTGSDLTGLELVILSHGYNENRPGTYLHYSFLADHLAANGYVVASIQHELPTDEPLPMKGDLLELRRPDWERGVANIRFAMEELERLHPELDRAHTALIGHSNGGDISMLFARTYPALIDKVISLDNRRMPLPRVAEPRIYSLRASDTVADEGVLPSTDEAERYGMRIVQLVGTKHAEMSDRAGEAQRAEMNRLVLGFLNEKR
ncbi:MAG TPA: hypothetical protein VKG92_00665 [Flavobacteriales bacterium]|nr:hypothetical protein [Flavobacteriales bacterium]